MHKALFFAIALAGLLPGVVLLIPAIQSRPGESELPPPRPGGAPMMWGHTIELRIAGLRVPFEPKPWKTVCLASGMLLYLLGIAVCVFGRPGQW